MSLPLAALMNSARLLDGLLALVISDSGDEARIATVLKSFAVKPLFLRSVSLMASAIVGSRNAGKCSISRRPCPIACAVPKSISRIESRQSSLATRRFAGVGYYNAAKFLVRAQTNDALAEIFAAIEFGDGARAMLDAVVDVFAIAQLALPHPGGEARYRFLVTVRVIEHENAADWAARRATRCRQARAPTASCAST